MVSVAKIIKHAEKTLLFHHLYCLHHFFQQSYIFRDALHQARQTHGAHHTCTRSHHRRSRHSHRRIARIRRLLGQQANLGLVHTAPVGLVTLGQVSRHCWLFDRTRGCDGLL